MFQLIALVIGSGLGFVASRTLRRTRRPGTERGSSAPAVAGASVASVGRSVGGALGRRKGLNPPELQRACLSEMIRHVGAGPSGRHEVPTRFVLRLHPDDVATVDEGRRWFLDGLSDALLVAARDHGWTVAGAPDISVEADPDRRPGVPAAFAVAPGNPPGTPPAPPEAAPASASSKPAGRPETRTRTSSGNALVRTDTNERTALGDSTVTIGRGSDRTIIIDDSRVSRSHASLRRTPAGWAVVDDGSSNGTRLNGEELRTREERVLAPGDVIEVGPVGLRFEAPHPAPTRLTDAERTRISGEAFGDRRGGDAS